MTAPLLTKLLRSELVLLWSVIICSANLFSSALPFSCANVAAAIWSMSLLAASLMKSAMVGLMPSAELTPVLSPMDCASAGPAARMQPNAIIERFMILTPSLVHVDPAAVRRPLLVRSLAPLTGAAMASSWNHHDLAAIPFCSLQKQFTSKHPLGNNHVHYRPLAYLGPMILCYGPPCPPTCETMLRGMC